MIDARYTLKSKGYGFLLLVIMCCLSAGMGPALAESLPKLQISVLKTGTVNWELKLIKHYEMDKARGFELVIDPVASGANSRIKFEAEGTDMIVADWIWAIRARAKGEDVRFFPYSRSVGGIYWGKDKGGAKDKDGLQSLAGKKIGIAGGPLDKSWLLARALYQKRYGEDLSKVAEPVFGAPPLIMKQALQGEVDAAINFWHFLAKMEAGGLSPLITVDEIGRELGLDPATPLLGYIFNAESAAFEQGLVDRFLAAVQDIKARLASEDAVWLEIKDQMRVKNDAQYQALIKGFRAGIPASYAVNEETSLEFLTVLRDIGKEKLLGSGIDEDTDLRALMDGLFYLPAS